MVEQEVPQQAKDERAVALGPGLVRRADGVYLRPSEVEWTVDCLGPIAYWRVALTYGADQLESDQLESDQEAYFLFPLPPQASIKRFRLGRSEGGPGPEPSVTSLQALPEDTEIPTPPGALLKLFATEPMPVLSLRLGPVLSAGSGPLKVELELCCGLPTVDGRIRLRLPRRAEESLAVQGETSYSLEVRFEDGQEFVEPPACSLEFESEQDGESLKLSALFESPDHEDLEVSFRPGRTEMPVTRLRRDPENFIFSIFPPSSIHASPQRRDIVFILDASENMHGGMFESVRNDLAGVLRELEDSDRFALVTFGRDIDGYRGGEFCELQELDEACAWLQKVEPRGRADVQPLLARIQSLPSQPDRQLCIFLLAAGHVGNEPAILRSLDFDQSDRRYYTVGIGPTTQQAFLRRLALLTRGRCEVAPKGNCREPLARLLGQTRALLTEVAFEPSDDDGGAYVGESLVPSLMTSLTPQGPVHCLGLGSPQSLRFRSKDETGVFFAGTAHANTTQNPALGGVWASLKVREMLDSISLSTGAKRKALREEVSALATAHGILVEDTVLVLPVADRLEVQLSALPYSWPRGGEPAGASNEEEGASSGLSSAEFRRGLVARDGLFKGARMPGESDMSAESPTRHGLRSRSTGASENGGKPMLERPSRNTTEEFPNSEQPEMEGKATQESPGASVGASQSPGEPGDQPGIAVEPQQQVQELQAQQAEPGASAAQTPVTEQAQSSEEAQESAGDSGPYRVPVPVYRSGVDRALSARDRFRAYREEFEVVETRTALAALAGLPAHLVRSGPELPRILAQTVAHLEKRGYYSAALSVLGMLLQEHRSPEVLKKFEDLLLAWVDSLGPENLPEALSVLELGGRICPGSEALSKRLDALGGQWREAAARAESADGYQVWQARCRELEKALPETELPSKTQEEIWKLEQQQRALVQQVEELKAELRHQRQLMENLPAQLEAAKADAPGAAVKAESSSERAQEELKRFTEEQLAPLRAAMVEMGGLLRELTSRPPGAQAAAPAQASQAKGEPQQAVEPRSSTDVSAPPAPVSTSKPAGEPTAEPTAKPIAGATTKPATESAVERTVEPATEPATKPAPEPTVERAVEHAAEAPLAPGAADPPGPGPDSEPGPAPAPVQPQPSADEPPSVEELQRLLAAEPSKEELHKAVRTALPSAKERVAFFRELVKVERDEPYHSLSLARAYREGEQTKVAVVHYQKYLRSEKDPLAYLELADAYDELGKGNLSLSARKAAQLYAK